jgi:hypothetical protein
MQDNLEHFPPQESFQLQQETLHEQPVVDVDNDPVPEQESQQMQSDIETPSARNFRQLREKAERAERERDEAMNYIRSLQAQQKQVPVEDDLGLADDDLVERKHVDRIIDKKIRKYEQQLQHYQQEQQAQQVLNEYKDYRDVVTKENVDALIQQYPDIAESLKSNPDIRSKAIAAYNIIKKLGINTMNTQAPYAQDIQRIKANAAKPKPLASVNPQQGDSPLSRANAFANGLTDDLKEQLRKEMNDSRRGY